MSVPPRTPAPSAIDGYRRMVVPPAEPARTDGDVQPARIPRSRRIAGATRIAGLLAVIAVIAGTSIGLATADPKQTHEERTANAVARPDASGPILGPPAPRTHAQKQAPTDATRSKHVTTKHAVEKIPVVKHAAAVVPAATRTQAAAASATQAAVAPPSAAPSRELPFTGAADVVLLRLLLAGASVALLGMLLQIAGTPLPAHAIERKRLASRAT